VGLPRYLAAGSADDLERTLRMADDLVSAPNDRAPVCVVQCGRASGAAAELAEMLRAAGRPCVSLVIKERLQAQSEATLVKIAGASAIWVFAEDLFEAFMTVFATQLAFALRASASDGLPVIGVGPGAVALGGLLLANRICKYAQYGLVSGLGWAPRVLVDAGANRGAGDRAIAHATIRSLPGLLGVDLGVKGGVRVEGGRIESVGSEQILLLGASEDGGLLVLPLEPGQKTTIAPPPFAPFERGLVSRQTALALSAARPIERPARRVLSAQPVSPPVTTAPSLVESEAAHAKPGSGRMCPMCKKVHVNEPRLELAA
jgi:cyanophycinase-like exopeptidase